MGRNNSKGFIYMAVAGAVLLIAIIVLCLCADNYYSTHYYPNTYINDEDFSGETVKSALRKLGLSNGNQKVEFICNDGSVEVLKCESFDYATSAESELEEIMASQQDSAWFSGYSLFGGKEYDYTLELTISYDETKLEDALYSMNFVVNGTTESLNASLEKSSDGFYISEEVVGNVIDKDQLLNIVKNVLSSGEMTIDLTSSNCYVLPEITSTNPNLIKSLEKIESIQDVVITYDFKDRTETLDKNSFLSWIEIDEDGNIALNDNSLSLFVSQLAYKYDTYQSNRQFTTTAGNTITVGGGIYGWQIDKEEEAAALKELILSGVSETREPIYYIEGFERGEDDIGSTYIEIDLTTQHLWYYIDGELFLESDIISGYPYNGHSTPTGVFCVWSREKDRYLVGETYNTHVDYWMPINWDGVGLHDAWWQTDFGGTTYQTAMGSHGCVNLPTDVAASIYENVEVGTPVIIYES